MSSPILLISGNYNAFLEGFYTNTTGVYMCSGLFTTESVKLPIYIGSSVDVEDRIQSQHIPRLNGFKHENIYLNRAWLKYGQGNFVWYLMESCPEDKKLEIEQKYFDIYKPFVSIQGGYNISETAYGPPIRRGKDHSSFGKKRPDNKLRAEMTGRPYKFISPNGEVFEGKGLNEFAKKHGLNRTNLRDVLDGKVSQHKGWKNGFNPKEKVIGKEFKLLSPSGEIFTGTNFSEFCRQHSLCRIHIGEVLRNKTSHYKGWRNADSPMEMRGRGRNFLFKKPNGEIISGINMKKFCEENNLNYNMFQSRKYIGKTFLNGWTRLE